MTQGDLAEEQCLKKAVTVWGSNHFNHETYSKWGKIISWIGISEYCNYCKTTYSVVLLGSDWTLCDEGLLHPSLAAVGSCSSYWAD